MTDYSKFKVPELKDECKSRGISLTGLKLKQQFIDRLEEDDASKERDPGSAGDDIRVKQGEMHMGEGEEAALNTSVELDETAPQENVNGEQEKVVEDVSGAEHPVQEDEGNPGMPDDTDTASQEIQIALGEGKEARQDADEVDKAVVESSEKSPPKEGNKESVAEIEDKVAKDTDDLFIREPPAPIEMDKAKEEQPATLEGITKEAVLNDPRAEQTTGPMPNQVPASALPTDLKSSDTPTDSATSSQPPAIEVAEDQRKRKRRSLTPVPSAEEIALKKARANDGKPIVTETEKDSESDLAALEKVKEATRDAEATREGTNIRDMGVEIAKTEEQHLANPVAGQPQMGQLDSFAPAPIEKPPSPMQEQRPEESPSPSPEPSRHIPPSIHPATTSLYIRNFKRPLHLPTLRSRISTLSRSKTDPTDSDPITLFYLDSIRTHAFVSFSTVASASRVRNEMHETRFPDEKTRDLLWVDFIPAQKVEEWIDVESGGGSGGLGGGRGGNKRWEVVYQSTQDGGIEASLVDAESARRMPGLAGASQQGKTRPSIDTRPSVSEIRSSGPMSGAGVHPDRASFVPRSPEAMRSFSRDMEASTRPYPPDSPRAARQSKPSHQQVHPDQERNFKPLDALFSSTMAKPKLYYKPVQPEVVDARMRMIRGLRVGHEGMGRSGEEGMMRFGFEKTSRGEEWVSRGPEFGRGRRGLGDAGRKWEWWWVQGRI